MEVDADLATEDSRWQVVFSTLANDGVAATTTWSRSPLRRAIPITLKSNELQILARG